MNLNQIKQLNEENNLRLLYGLEEKVCEAIVRCFEREEASK